MTLPKQTNEQHVFNSELVKAESGLFGYGRQLARAAFEHFGEAPSPHAGMATEIEALERMVEAGERARLALDAYKGAEAIMALYQQ